MTRDVTEVTAVAVGLAYLAALTVAMSTMSFDIWGAMLLVPIYGVLGLVLIRRTIPQDSTAVVVALSWGLGFKLCGAFARYWVGFEAYGGGIDASSYHEYGRLRAGGIRSGEVDFIEAIPTGSGTEFVENVTAFVYTLTGSSQLGGFLTFSFFAFIGVVYFVKAAILAVPGVNARRYAWLCVLMPSLVYWPSSIGKEALVLLGTGVASYGIALLVTQRRWFGSILVVASGIGFMAFIRPHMAGLWMAAALPAILLAVLRRPNTASARAGRGRLVVTLLVACVCFAGLASLTLRFFGDLGDADGSSITAILDETQRRTSEANSNFVPPSIASPANWPFAIVRTLARPLPIEARGLAQLLAAGEIALLGGMFVLWWRSMARSASSVVRVPYVLFALSVVVLGGLAFASLANTGVLTRQKSLLFPMLLLLPCLTTARSARSEHRDPAEEVEHRRRQAHTEARLAAESRSNPDTGVTDVDAFWAEQVR